jgi:hypothetical protein
VKADPLMCVNFESEGDPRWSINPLGEERSGNAEEAQRGSTTATIRTIANGSRMVSGSRFRSTCGNSERNFLRAESLQEGVGDPKTIEFSQAMRKVDPTIQLIGWGDSGWAPEMIERAGGDDRLRGFSPSVRPGRATE